MSKKVITHSNGVFETRETFYTEETIQQLKQQLEEKDQQIDQLKQENETLFLQLSKQEIDEHKPVYCTLAGNDCKYLGKIKQLKQQLAEKEKEIAHLKEKDNYHLRYELAGADETIANLKKQLAEKDNLIEFGREEIRKRNKRIDEIVERDKKLFDNKNKELEKLKQQLVEKDEEIKSLIADYEKRISQEQELMSNIEHRLTEKQNTIDEINKEFVQAVHDWKTLCKKKDKEIEDWKQKIQTFLNRVSEQNYEIANNNSKQLAIQELEKVKELLITESKRYPIVYDITDDLVGGAIDKDKTFEIIDNQINELKKG